MKHYHHKALSSYGQLLTAKTFLTENKGIDTMPLSITEFNVFGKSL